ncbi:hypothetical protein [Streptomyces sp. NPDC005125]
MGKASRCKKERNRQGAWTAADAARSALDDRTATRLLLEDNPYAAAHFAAVTDRTFMHALWHQVRSHRPLVGGG